MRTLALPQGVELWSLTSLCEKLIKVGARVVSHCRHVIFQMAEVAVSCQMFRETLSLIARRGRRLRRHDGGSGQMPRRQRRCVSAEAQ
jgi:hypothetical protein